MGTIVQPGDVELGKVDGAVAKGDAAVRSVEAVKGSMDRAVADQIAVIRAEIGLTGTGLIDELANEDFEGLGLCGDLGSSLGDMCKIRVHGNCCDGLVYRVVIFLATLYSLNAVHQAVLATRQYKHETSFEVTKEDAIELPKVEVCIARYGRHRWYFTSITAGRNETERTWHDAEHAEWTPGTPFTFEPDGGNAGNYSWIQTGDIAGAAYGDDFAAKVKLESTFEKNPHDPDSRVIVETFCISLDAPPSPKKVDDYLVFRLGYELSCLDEYDNVDATCSGDDANDDFASSTFDDGVGGGWSKPVIVSFLKMTDAAGEETRHYCGVDEYTILGLTKLSNTEEERCTLTVTEGIFGGECAGEEETTDRFLTSVSSFNLSPGAAGLYGKWRDGRLSSEQRVFMHMDTMQVSHTKSKWVPKGTWADVWATLGGAAASVAVVVALFFAPLNLEQRSPTAGAPSKPFVIGRWRLCNKKSIVRHAKRAAVSAIKESLIGGLRGGDD